MSEQRRKRKLPKQCVNPLFLQWLDEWRVEAESKGLQSHHSYRKAMQSLKKYPIVLRSGGEAKVLSNFGDKICKMLDARLKEHIEEFGEDSLIVCDDDDAITALPNIASTSTHLPVQTNESNLTANSISNHVKTKRTVKAREYIPAHRSGPYALLLTLYNHYTSTNSLTPWMGKQELQEAAQPLSDKSFTVSDDPQGRYTAWSSMSTLISKLLVSKQGSPAKYEIADAGRQLAERILEGQRKSTVNKGVTITAETKSGSHISSLPSTSSTCSMSKTTSNLDKPMTFSSTSSLPSNLITKNNTINSTASTSSITSPVPIQQPDVVCYNNVNTDPGITLLPGTFDIILYVDVSETTGGIQNNRKDELVPELRKNGVHYEIRRLWVGDYAWVARERVVRKAGQLNVRSGKELVLDVIIERKRMDDLAGSIIDGRFREQKFRLRSCGLGEVIYLVEDLGSLHCHQIPAQTLMQAVTNTQVIDGFYVKNCPSLKESAAYLTLLTRYLTSTYSRKTLRSCSRDEKLSRGWRREMRDEAIQHLLYFDDFNESSVKNKVPTVHELFCKQLMQFARMNAEKVVAVTDVYQTPMDLINAYDNCNVEKEKELLLSRLKYGSNIKSSIGPALSKAVYHLYCNNAALK